MTDRIRNYRTEYTFGVFPKLSDRLVLISLICFSYKHLKAKDNSLTFLILLQKITKDFKPNKVFREHLENLAIVCEDFYYGTNEIESFGLTKSKEIIDKIKEILKTWIPF